MSFLNTGDAFTRKAKGVLVVEGDARSGRDVYAGYTSLVRFVLCFWKLAGVVGRGTGILTFRR
jgi:hypothetical protein